MGGNVARMGKLRYAYETLVGEPEGQRPRGSPNRIWEDNIRIDVKEIG